MNIKFYNLIIILFLFSEPFSIKAQLTSNLTSDPEKILFIFDDIHNFNNAYKMLSMKTDTAKVMKSYYFDLGTPGLKVFIKKYNLTIEDLVEAITKYPDAFDSVKYIPELIASEVNAYRSAFIELKKYIPNLVFPPIYFLIGSYSGIGSASEEGLLIEVEKWKIGKADRHTTLLVHELTHFQQVMAVGLEKYRSIYGPEKSLLALVIREGIAEFFANLITGRYSQEQARNYVTEHEQELWEKFKTEMDGEETGDWMWKKPENSNQPKDVGYVFGAKIVESYYINSEDKKIAIDEILSVTDYKNFLDKSGFSNNFFK